MGEQPILCIIDSGMGWRAGSDIILSPFLGTGGWGVTNWITVQPTTCIHHWSTVREFGELTSVD